MGLNMMDERDRWYSHVMLDAQNHRQMLAAARLYPSLLTTPFHEAVAARWIDDLTRQLFKRAYLKSVRLTVCA